MTDPEPFIHIPPYLPDGTPNDCRNPNQRDPLDFDVHGRQWQPIPTVTCKRCEDGTCPHHSLTDHKGRPMTYWGGLAKAEGEGA